jgi:hypothetical protein
MPSICKEDSKAGHPTAAKGLDPLVVSASFFLYAACTRGGRTGSTPEEYPPYGAIELSLRPVAFILLFASVVRHLRAWQEEISEAEFREHMKNYLRSFLDIVDNI